MKKMLIYEPAMCCSTGLCGVGVDPELLRISTTIDTLKKKGFDVQRFNLSSDPFEFVSNKLVNEFLNTKGVDSLPLIILDSHVVISGRYPTNQEFVKLLNLPNDVLSAKINTKANHNNNFNCCDGEEGCC